MGIMVAVVLGSGLAFQQAVTQPRAVALSNCVPSPAIAVHAFIARQPVCILPNHKYTAKFNTTSGQFVMELLPDYAPVTVNNFVVLALNGYYTGSLFWKAEDWVVQAAEPKRERAAGPRPTAAREDTPS